MAAKSMVDKYEQILSQDPTSTVFVELAKALIEKGDHGSAIDVCRRGLVHHKSSVVGRVLWGKALIHMGRPAEAMEQFDEAISIDRDNPHAYNLIGEVLLHKGLYRSALPLLRKAAALQPNDGRIRQWLEQTQRALEGGPAPVLTEATDVQSGMTDPPDAAAPDLAAEPTQIVKAFVPQGPLTDQPTPGVAQPQAPTPGPQVASSPDLSATLEDLAGTSPTGVHPRPLPKGSRPVSPQPSAAAVSAGLPVVAPVPPMAPSSASTLAPAPTTNGKGAHAAKPHAAAAPPPIAATPTDPFGQFPPAPDPQATVSGMTATFEALSPSPDAPPAGDEPSVVPSKDLLGDGPIERTEVTLNLEGLEASAAKVAPPPVPRTSAEHRALLAEIPDLKEPAPPPQLPRVNFTPQATEALAKEYERELREKLAAQAEVAKKSFLARNGKKIAFASIAVAAVLAGVVAFFVTRAANQGRDFKDAVALGKKGIAEDTLGSYRAALESLKLALSMDDESVEAWSLSALAHSLLYAEHGGRAENKAQAEEALRKKGVQETYPDLALLASYHLSDAKSRDGLRKQILAGRPDSNVEEMAGRILLSQKDSEGALKRFRSALDLNPRNVRALVALGDYYREAGDYASALTFYTGDAAKLSPRHPNRALGAAETRLALEQDEAQSLKEVEVLGTGEDVLAPELLVRKELVQGRLLSAVGQHEEAIKRLSEGLASFKSRAYDFQLALANAYYRAGRMAPAEQAFQAALSARGTEDAKLGLGRVLLAADRPAEVLRRIRSEDSRKVALVRAMAHNALGEWKKARSELAKTQVAGKFPAEAVIQLAVADAGEGKPERAQEVLEKTLAATKKAKANVRAALGDVYWARRALDKAKAQYEAAAAEPDDWEASCALGRLLLAQGRSDLAIEPLARSVARNDSHDDSNHALIQALVEQGRFTDALARAEAWQTAEAPSANALGDLAMAQYLNGRAKDAEALSARAVNLAPKDAGLLRWRARIQYARGDGRGAFESLEAATKAAPEDGENACELALSHFRHGKMDGVMKALQSAEKATPKPHCAVLVGVYAKPDKGALKALHEVSSHARTASDKGWLKMAMARALLAAGDPERALKEAEAAVALVPHSGFAQLALGLVLAKQKNDVPAREALTRAAVLEPALGTARVALADVMLRGGDTELPGAVEQYEAFLRTGGTPAEEARVKKTLAGLKKRLAAR